MLASSELRMLCSKHTSCNQPTSALIDRFYRAGNNWNLCQKAKSLVGHVRFLNRSTPHLVEFNAKYLHGAFEFALFV